MSRPRLTLHVVIVFSLFVLVGAYISIEWPDHDVSADATLPVPAITEPHEAVQTAWRRARDAGTYDFTADVIQETIPLAQVTNVGRASEESRFHIEGATNLPDNQMEMVLWTGGGSVADPQSGIEVKIDGQTAKARRGDGEWHTVDNFGDVFAPQGDFMAYLVAADDVRRAGSSSTRHAGTSATRSPPRSGTPTPIRCQQRAVSRQQ